MTTLDTLPTEIIFNILFFTSSFNSNRALSHPLYNLAATNKPLRSHVEEYTRILLKQHANFTVPKKSKKFVCRKKWIKWLDSTCQICKKKSVRKAILDPTLTCCATCDRATFSKLPMSTVLTHHGLTKLDLFTPNALHPNLRPLTVGTYVCGGADTTMISESDVLARKKLIHGLLLDSSNGACVKRKSRHNLLLKHMDPTIPAGSSAWIPGIQGETTKDFLSAALRTPESRAAFVRDKLREEWAAMGMKGSSTDDAIELE